MKNKNDIDLKIIKIHLNKPVAYITNFEIRCNEGCYRMIIDHPHLLIIKI